MPIPPAANYISCPLHQLPITTASTLITFLTTHKQQIAGKVMSMFIWNIELKREREGLNFEKNLQEKFNVGNISSYLSW